LAPSPSPGGVEKELTGRWNPACPGGVVQGMRVTAEDGADRPYADTYGGEEAFDRFFRSTYAESIRLAHLLTGDRWAAEDIAQDTYTRLHGRFAALDNADAYLRVSLVNAAQSFHRSRGREAARLQRLAIGATETVAPEAAELLDAVDRLPHRQRAVVVLRYYLDLSETEIAAVIGCRPGTVKSLASRALARLSKEITR
jgi:RNA polymerase sigma-70 factor (sigma-E family)